MDCCLSWLGLFYVSASSRYVKFCLALPGAQISPCPICSPSRFFFAPCFVSYPLVSSCLNLSCFDKKKKNVLPHLPTSVLFSWDVFRRNFISFILTTYMVFICVETCFQHHIIKSFSQLMSYQLTVFFYMFPSVLSVT